VQNPRHGTEVREYCHLGKPSVLPSFTSHKKKNCSDRHSICHTWYCHYLLVCRPFAFDRVPVGWQRQLSFLRCGRNCKKKRGVSPIQVFSPPAFWLHIGGLTNETLAAFGLPTYVGEHLRIVDAAGDETAGPRLQKHTNDTVLCTPLLTVTHQDLFSLLPTG
jgi:hypothetical protein